MPMPMCPMAGTNQVPYSWLLPTMQCRNSTWQIVVCVCVRVPVANKSTRRSATVLFAPKHPLLLARGTSVARSNDAERTESMGRTPHSKPRYLWLCLGSCHVKIHVCWWRNPEPTQRTFLIQNESKRKPTKDHCVWSVRQLPVSRLCSGRRSWVILRKMSETCGLAWEKWAMAVLCFLFLS